MKQIILAMVLLSVVAPMAEAKGKKNKSAETPITTVVQTPTPAPAKPVTSSYMQQQIAKTLSRPNLNPLASCTYCAAYAASVGDLATVEAIGNPAP